MDLKLRSETFGSGDQSFIVDPALVQKVGCTLDLDLFDADQLAGWVDSIPAGVALGKVTATGKFGPYGAHTTETQTLTFDATGGDYDLTFDGETTDTLTYANDATDTDTITAALESLSNIQPGDVEVTRGVPSGNVTIFTVKYVGQYQGENVPQLTKTETLTGGSGTLTVATAGAGGAAASDGTETFAGILFDDIRFVKGATSGVLGASRIVLGAIYEDKLPFVGADPGTPGLVDAGAKTDMPSIVFI